MKKGVANMLQNLWAWFDTLSTLQFICVGLLVIIAGCILFSWFYGWYERRRYLREGRREWP